MKNADQMAQDVLRRIKAEKQQQQRKRRRSQQAIVTIGCCCLISGLFIGILQRSWLPTPPALSAPTVSAEFSEATASSVTEALPETAAPLEVFPEQTTEATPAAQSFLTLDINPSLQFVLEEGKILRCLALNDDGEAILSDLDLAGMTVEEALPLVLQALIDSGYIAADESSAPVLLLAAYDSNGSVELLDSAAAVVSDTLAEQNILGQVIAQQITDLEYVELLAEQYHVSVGKMQYVLGLIRREREVSLEEACDRTIVELFSMDIEQRLIEPEFKIGEYDQYGEKVLYGPTVEVPAEGWDWDSFTREYQDILLAIYSPEDLEMLSRDRIWTTMPDVVGLTEEEACTLLRSREIVPRVIHEDNEEFREKGYVDGQCFMQDAAPGMRWNSDASVFIWVLVTDADPHASSSQDCTYLHEEASTE